MAKSEMQKLNAKIDSLGKRTAKWRDDVQLILVQCAKHAFDGNNVDPCTRLVKAIHGADMAALIKWIEGHMPAVWIKAENKFRVNKSFKGEYDAIVLMAEPWWELAKKAKDVSSTLDMLESLRHFIKRMEKEAAKEIDGKKITVEHGELLAKLATLANEEEFKG